MSTYTVSRTGVVPADPGRVHALVDDFHAWPAWSPWEDVDPGLRRTYSGPDRGVGAAYEWSGNRKAGAGRMEITASDPTRVEVLLQFTKPFRSTSQVVLSFVPVDAGTEVTWTMTGEQKGLMGVVGRLVPMDRLVGPDMEKGLDRLASAVGAP